MNRIGLDIGGTFTDLIFIDEANQNLLSIKTSTTPKEITQGILDGIEKLHNIVGVGKLKNIDYFCHGTTIALNALLEKKGAKTALITTKGFEDILEVGKQARDGMYDLIAKRKAPILVPRKFRFGLEERISAQGEVIKNIDYKGLEEVVNNIKENQIESLAICFLHSYKNPIHEQMVRDYITNKLPHLLICISSEVLSEAREFPRLVTTVLTAYLGPVVKNYLINLQEKISYFGIDKEINIMQSNQGMIPIKLAVNQSARTLLSGPCGGVAGAACLATLAGFKNIISFDMGGTSADISLLPNGQPLFVTGREISGLPVNFNMVDIKTIGAGGGSIAWIDSMGKLQVGPQSAGAWPGPICYDRGGNKVTVTDANLILGRLPSDSIWGKEKLLNIEKSKKIMESNIAKPLNCTIKEAAYGILKIVNNNMANSIRAVSVERGFDPRDFVLVAFGGAGGLHAIELAESLGIKKVLVPMFSGVLSALGLASLDKKTDFVKTNPCNLEQLTREELLSNFNELKEKALQWFKILNVSNENQRLKYICDMKYSNQNYELPVEISKELLDKANNKKIGQLFHDKHESIYGYKRQSENVVIFNYRMEATGKVPQLKLPKKKNKQKSNINNAIRKYQILFLESTKEGVKCPVYNWDLISIEAKIKGPAIIEQKNSTIMVLPTWEAYSDEFGSTILYKNV